MGFCENSVNSRNARYLSHKKVDACVSSGYTIYSASTYRYSTGTPISYPDANARRQCVIFFTRSVRE